jgi:hypothetical protein
MEDAVGAVGRFDRPGLHLPWPPATVGDRPARGRAHPPGRGHGESASCVRRHTLGPLDGRPVPRTVDRPGQGVPGLPIEPEVVARTRQPTARGEGFLDVPETPDDDRGEEVDVDPAASGALVTRRTGRASRA